MWILNHTTIYSFPRLIALLQPFQDQDHAAIHTAAWSGLHWLYNLILQFKSVRISQTKHYQDQTSTTKLLSVTHRFFWIDFRIVFWDLTFSSCMVITTCGHVRLPPYIHLPMPRAIFSPLAADQSCRASASTNDMFSTLETLIPNSGYQDVLEKWYLCFQRKTWTGYRFGHAINGVSCSRMSQHILTHVSANSG